MAHTEIRTVYTSRNGSLTLKFFKDMASAQRWIERVGGTNVRYEETERARP